MHGLTLGLHIDGRQEMATSDSTRATIRLQTKLKQIVAYKYDFFCVRKVTRGVRGCLCVLFRGLGT